MNTQTNIPLSSLTTIKLGGNADYVVSVSSKEEIQQLYRQCKQLDRPVYVIGKGSNLIAKDEGFPGVIIVNEIKGIAIVDDNSTSTTATAGAGEIWDDFVSQMVARNLSGIEAMSGIPGTVGAAPVQNIGAYGQELSNTFVSLEAYDTTTDSFVTLSWDDCQFSYRHSIFRGESAGRYIITQVTLTLFKQYMEPPFYDSLENYFEQHQIDTATVTPQMVREAVLAVRADKLPDPVQLPNAGSFFKNPVVENWLADDIQRTYPDLKTYPVDEYHKKIPAGWLIENANLKGEIIDGIKVHEKNAVVLINESASSYADLANARSVIIDKVSELFRITLEQEPLELT